PRSTGRTSRRPTTAGGCGRSSSPTRSRSSAATPRPPPPARTSRSMAAPDGARSTLPALAWSRFLCTMADTSTQSIVIVAPAARVAEVICDFARYPEWVGAAKSVEVTEEYDDGYASQVRFVLDAGVVADEYV